MNPAKRIGPLVLSCSIVLLLQACGHALTALPGLEQEAWKQFAAAAGAQPHRPGEVDMQLAWEIPGKRLLMLARTGEGQQVLYQIDHKPGLKPDDNRKQVNCHFQDERLYCAGPGEETPSPVAGPGANVWSALEGHAGNQARQLNAYGRTAVQAQLASHQPVPRFDLARQRHPFEWGGEHETVENAQAFLEAVTAQGTPFRSSWPEVPWLGSQGNAWQNESDFVTFKTTGRCTTLASSPSRIAIHSNHDFWASDTIDFHTVYRWQQPIDWGSVGGVEAVEDGVFIHGTYAGPFTGQGLAYVSGWNPDILTANATRFNPEKYSVAAWNVRLLLPSTNGMRERVLYAATYLNLMCGKR